MLCVSRTVVGRGLQRGEGENLIFDAKNCSGGGDGGKSLSLVKNFYD